jgi:hypothetical protein
MRLFARLLTRIDVSHSRILEREHKKSRDGYGTVPRGNSTLLKAPPHYYCFRYNSSLKKKAEVIRDGDSWSAGTPKKGSLSGSSTCKGCVGVHVVIRVGFQSSCLLRHSRIR